MDYIRKDKFTKPYSTADVLNLALSKEQSSYDFYEQILEETKADVLKKLLTELRDAERGHIEKIKGMLERTA